MRVSTGRGREARGPASAGAPLGRLLGVQSFARLGLVALFAGPRNIPPPTRPFVLELLRQTGGGVPGAADDAAVDAVRWRNGAFVALDNRRYGTRVHNLVIRYHSR